MPAELPRGADPIGRAHEQRHHAVMRASWDVAIEALRARTVQSMFNARLNLAECLSLASVLVTGFVLIDHGASTVGAATTAMLLVLRLLDPINQLLFVIDTVQSAAASLNRIVGITTIPDTEADPEPGGPRTAGDTAVRLHEVAFRYGDGPRVLDGITLDIPAGEHVAVVGASGAGKTTLAAVIAGIHPPGTGTVTRPDRTAVITQEVHVFAGTVRDNLTLAAPGAGDLDVRAALEASGTAVVVDLLPDGLDTLVGSGGHQLTDAEAQQIALVRLLLLDPELAILDETTAEAGSTHARLLDRTAEAALRGRTALVIAHRLSQAAACDRIVVMEHGRIDRHPRRAGRRRRHLRRFLGGLAGRAGWPDGQMTAAGDRAASPRPEEGQALATGGVAPANELVLRTVLGSGPAAPLGRESASDARGRQGHPFVITTADEAVSDQFLYGNGPCCLGVGRRTFAVGN